MPTLNRALWFNGLIDDDGSGTTGTIWKKSEVGLFMDTIDAALASTGYTPAAHAASHKSGGADVIRLDELAAPTDVTTLNASVTAHGLLPKLPGTTTTFLRGDGTFVAVPPAAPAAHATTHKSGGTDAIKLDELAAPTDVVTLNASTTAHGLLPKLPGTTTVFLRGDGTFATPTGTTPAAHATTHASAGSDPVTITTLAGFPGGTGTYLRADGTFAAPPGGAHAATHAAGGGDTVNVTTLGGYPGTTTTFLRGDGQFVVPPGGGGGGGNVTGPGTSVIGNVATFNDTTGTTLADTGVALSALERTANRNAASGYAGLDASSRLTGTQLPYGTAANTACQGNDARLADARTPTAHATTHKSGGADAIKIDELAAPTDVTTLNVSTSAHGLAPKLPGNTTTFLRGDGTYAAPVTATPGGADTQVQFNDAGAFGGDSGLTFNKTTKVVTMAGDVVFSSSLAIRRNTSDGSDNGSLAIAGGGAVDTARGALVVITGNENASPGSLFLKIGNVAGSNFQLFRSDGTVAMIIDGATGLASLTTSSAQPLTINSTYVDGGYVTFQKSGVVRGYLGSGNLLGGGANTDLALRAEGALYLLSAVNVFSPVMYNNTTGVAANMNIDNSGVLRRSTSSRKHKRDIAPLDDWQAILALEPVSYVHVSDRGERRVGFIAEQVAAVDPRLAVFNAEGEPDEVAYGHLTAPIICALQDLARRLNALELKG
jgi:Chaperone of endosialidase